MRRALTTLAVASVLFVAGTAFAKDDPPPPPPPPPPSDTTTSDEKKEGDAPKSGDFHSTDALLDVSKGKHRPMMLSFFLGVSYPYWSGVSIPIGARFNIPIIHDGFVPQINDSFDIEFGLDFAIVPSPYFHAPFFILPVVEPRYTVYLLPNLAAYVKPLCLGVAIWPPNNCPGCGVAYFHYEFAVGVVYDLTKTISLRGQVGSHSLRGGIGIAL